ncbi:MAG: hypothetical protein J6S85_06545 [Methanobrevibacter sp.]|nr:hypothetical protein [Methanobrevibacter sp.]
MPAFTGQLNANEIFAALYNMIISQEVRADNVAGTFSSLVDKSRVDGSLYGDTKLFYSPDVLKSRDWLGDNEAANLLNVNRPAAPECQAITLDVFRQIDITVDNYLSKRAWIDEGAFASFNSVMLGMIRTTKRVYDATTFNAYIGTAVSAASKNTIQVVPVTGTDTTSADIEGANRIYAESVAETLANLFVDLRDVSRDYNDYAQLKSYDLEDLIVVWNAAKVNKIKSIDLPTIFHKEGLIQKFEEEILPERYFGVVITSTNVSTYSDSTPAAGKPLTSGTGVYVPGSNHANGRVFSLYEKEVTVGGTAYHVFAGDEIPAGATVLSTGGNFAYGEVAINDADIICKVMHKKSVPFMSAFEVGTSFFNARSLTENHYLTWGHNTIEYLKSYPFITITE